MEIVVVVIVAKVTLLACCECASIDGVNTTDVSALCNAVVITGDSELDAESAVMLSDVFDLGGGDQWATPADVVGVCNGVV
jgi:hypothetical protein